MRALGQVRRRSQGLIARAYANTRVLADWKAKTPWIISGQRYCDPLQHLGVHER